MSEPTKEAMEIARLAFSGPKGAKRRLMLAIDAHTSALRAEVAQLREKLRLALEALKTITQDHGKDNDGDPWCRMCGPAGGRYPCATKLEADSALRAAGVDI